ncbi:restriction endonuclease subunit S [Terribacillus saccharophilus]|uniref:restriction endonuclease subunit S n=1 Tax=Terribacillus saccharophilus TaxID=361277 RepID=UPI00381E3D88
MNKQKKSLDELLEESLVPLELQPYSLPDNWVWVYAESVLDFIGGGTPSKSNLSFWNGSIPWASVKDIKGRYLNATIDSITNEGLENSSATLANEGELLLVTRMAPGKSTITNIQTTINQDLKIVRPKASISSHFLWLYFTVNTPVIESDSTGSTVKGIQVQKLNKYLFPLPPFKEQKRIADKVESLLNRVDEAKQLIDEVRESLDSLRGAVINQALSSEITFELSNKNTDLDMKYGDSLPPKWKVKKFGEIIKVKSGNALTKKNMNIQGQIPVYGGNGISGAHDKWNVENETLVIGRVGYYCGSVHLTPKRAWVTDNAFIVAYDDALLDKEYLYWQLKLLNLNQYSNASAQPVISGRSLKSVVVLIPPIDEQRKVSTMIKDTVKKINNKVEIVESLLKNIDVIKQSILSKAMKGELGTNDPIEENEINKLKEVLQLKTL